MKMDPARSVCTGTFFTGTCTGTCTGTSPTSSTTGIVVLVRSTYEHFLLLGIRLVYSRQLSSAFTSSFHSTLFLLEVLQRSQP
jgi:hypothetical protein